MKTLTHGLEPLRIVGKRRVKRKGLGRNFQSFCFQHNNMRVSCVTPVKDIPTMQKPTLAIAFTRKNNLPLIAVKMKDRECHFLIDTGIKECRISKSFYYEMGGSEKMVIDDKTIMSLTFSGHTFRIPMVLSEIYSQDFIGIIGTGFLHKWKMHIDFDLEIMYSYIPVKHQEWTLVDFSRQFGKMKVNIITDPSGNTTLNECVFTDVEGIDTVVYVSKALKNYTAERISQEKDLLHVKVLTSGKYCLIYPLESVDLE